MGFWPALGKSLISICAVAAAAIVARALTPEISHDQSALLYLVAIVISALFLGSIPSLTGASAGFGLWMMQSAEPWDRHLIADSLTLFVFLVTAAFVSYFSAKTREKASQSAVREAEISLLFEASETISREADPNGAIAALSALLRNLCRVPKCLIWRTTDDLSRELKLVGDSDLRQTCSTEIEQLANAVAEFREAIGFDPLRDGLLLKGAIAQSSDHPNKIAGAYIPLIADSKLLGVLYVAPRSDHKQFSDIDRRLILTLANHVAFVLARDSLSRQASQAAALRESDILKDSIISLVSHELKSPLAAIIATASTGELDGSPHDALRLIVGEAERLTQILNNLLDLSRLEAGAWKPDKDWCDIAEIIATCLDSLPEDDASRVDVDIEQDLPLISADYIQIALALSNLLQNAAKYSPKDRPIDLDVTAEHNGVDERPSGVLVRIRDYGSGIVPDDIGHVFERFYRGPSQQSMGISGTGLGLSLVKAIMEAQGGRVWAANAAEGDECGAIFTIVLPVE